jgi:hypothetical protein
MDSTEKLAELLGHYMRRVWLAAGLPWDSGNDAEMATIARLVSEVAYDEARETIDNCVNPSALI